LILVREILPVSGGEEDGLVRGEAGGVAVRATEREEKREG